MFNLDAIDDHFPIRVDGKASYREGQKKAIEFALNSFNSGKQIVIIEGPTGSGKSAIGMALADMVDNSYYLTATKQLQDQLIESFDDIVELKGRNAYPCTFYDRFGSEMVRRGIWKQSQLEKFKEKDPNCNEGFCKTSIGKAQAGQNQKKQKCLKCFTVSGPNGKGKPSGDLELLPLGMKYSACPYYEQVFTAINSRKVTMNFSSFLFQTQMTKRFDNPRDMLIIDEAHNVEPQLMDFVSLTISDANLTKYGILIPELDTPLEYAVWFEEVKIVESIYQALEEARVNDQAWLEDDLSRTIKKYQMFMEHVQHSEWVSEHSTTQTGANKVILKPVFVDGMAHKLLFKYAHKIVLMSATILDVDIICKSLGLDKSHVAAIRLKNNFPIKNRPIYIKTVGKLTGGQDGMKKWGPSLVEGVDELVEKYKGQKGIIHTHNFAIQELLKNGCSQPVRSRFLFQQHFRDKSEMLQAHAKTVDSILVAPAMHEGVDLHGDLSRLQIICKIPFANFYDNAQLARRVELDQKYYVWLTALKLCQSCGRSIRSATDYADTYILDESIFKLLRDAKSILPTWFTESIIEL